VSHQFVEQGSWLTVHGSLEGVDKARRAVQAADILLRGGARVATTRIAISRATAMLDITLER
jgi:hypothetical protein